MSTPIETDLRPAPLSLAPLPPSSGQGAECCFRGTTRLETHPEFGDLVALEYEAHEPMARTLLESLAVEITSEFEIDSLRIVHALGRVAVGEDSVLIEVRAGHRDAAFLACRAAIDRLKERLPIFKVEAWTRGRSRPPGVTPFAPADE